ncbi:MAG: TRAP transporter small permease [Proteobacteria bacterium]|nr:TRAP transporter small permease [Pseudomonadota bacterium]
MILLLSAFLVTLDVIARALFNAAPFYSFELTEYGFALAVAFGYGYALLSKAHIRIDIVYQKFPPKTRTILDLATLAGLSAVAIFLSFYAFGVAAKSHQLGSVSNTTLSMPLVFPQSIWAIGLGWFAFVSVALLARCLWLWFLRRDEAVAGLIGVSNEAPEPEAATGLTRSGEGAASDGR